MSRTQNRRSSIPAGTTQRSLDVIMTTDWINAFRFDHLRFAGDQTLKSALCRFVACPNGFIGLQKQATRHMRVELPGDVASLINLKVV
jgi:hypothetical protein